MPNFTVDDVVDVVDLRDGTIVAHGATITRIDDSNASPYASLSLGYAVSTKCLRAHVRDKPYTLIDALARHEKSPNTFEVPSQAQIAASVPGDYLKIGVTFDQTKRVSPTDPIMRALWEKRTGLRSVDTERFWMKLTKIVNGREFHGTVANDLVYTAHHGLQFGDPLVAEQHHVLDVTKGD